MIYRQLLPIIVALMLQFHAAATLSATNAVPEASGTWVIHPEDPGPSTPQSGMSLFDRLFSYWTPVGREHEIPFPFEELVESIESMIDQPSDPRTPRVSQVMIPIGRSLQKEAAAPHYFRYPRKLIAVHGDSLVTGNQTGFALNNRVFIAYQEKARQLEVISYNNELGRFEFQIVNNYDQDRTVTVKNAPRVVCMSCHQNGGPIFSRSPWDETNFNAKIAEAIARARPDIYSSLLDTISVDASPMDIATDYANYLSSAQLIWEDGCGAEIPAPIGSVQCRAAFLGAILQLRMSGNLGFDEHDPHYINKFAQYVDRQWQAQWPTGLLIPTSDIPDLDPLNLVSDDASLNPLSPRVAKAHWKNPDRNFLKGLVRQLAGALIRVDDRRLDRRLFELSRDNGLNSKFVRSDCSLTFNDIDTSQKFRRADVRCAPTATAAELTLSVEFELRDDSVTNSKINNLRLPGAGFVWRVSMDQTRYRNDSGIEYVSASLVNKLQGQSARTTKGIRLHRFTISWRGVPATKNNLSLDARVEIDTVNDFAIVKKAIQSMTVDTLAGNTDALAPLPFRRRNIMQALFRTLGMDSLDWEVSRPE